MFKDFLQQTRDHTYSRQDQKARNLTLGQVRQQRIDQANSLANKTVFSKDHNKYINQTIHAIENDIRLGDKQLNELIKQARTLAGISADELLDFSLGDTQRNAELIRLLDTAVLNAYIQNVRKASSEFINGITIQDVINGSRLIDIHRANQQIWLASLYKRQGNVFHFMTNASQGSKNTNHYVTVQLHSYDNLVLNHSKPPTQNEIDRLLKEGKISFDCDCERHRYWYRYIATIGKYAYGVSEDRYPSTRNPRLTGLACKHVLRVMNHLTSGHMKTYLRKEAKEDIKDITRRNKSHRQNPAQIREENERQLKAMNNWNSKIHPTKKIRRELDKAVKRIAKEKQKELDKYPDRVPQADKASYQYCKDGLKNPHAPKSAKEQYKKEIKSLKEKYGDKLK